MAFETTTERMAIRNKLVNELLEVPVGAVITRERIDTVIGANTSSKSAILYSALRTAHREYGAVFTNQFGVGYERTHPRDAAKIGQKARHDIRRKSRVARHKVECLAAENANDMTNDQKLSMQVEIGLLGLIEAASGHGSAKRAMRAAEEADKEGRPFTHQDIMRNLSSIRI